MPNKRAALKALRTSRKHHLRNLDVQSELKTLAKKFEASLSAKKAEDAKAALQLLLKKIDTAGSKGILHANTAARNKSQFMRRFAASQAK